jgi:hypothetical protein
MQYVKSKTGRTGLEQSLPVVQRYYPGMVSPEGIVIIGRKNGLSEGEARKLTRRNINMRGRIAIQTYDDLLASAKTYVRSLKRNLSEIL